MRDPACQCLAFVQLRVIQYLNGLDATAAYVRMTLSVMADMRPFLLILTILVVGNRCVMHGPSTDHAPLLSTGV